MRAGARHDGAGARLRTPRDQQHLQRWLLAQGYQAQLEHRFTDGTRADVHVRWSLRRAAEQGHDADPSSEPAPASEPFTSQTLEVQLSPLTWPRLRERDERYRQHTDTVTWLFSRRSADLAAMTRAVDGVSFGVWARPEPAGQGHGLAVLIGTHRTAAGTIWEPLEHCLLQSDGLWTPSREQALSDHAADAAMKHQDTNAAGSSERLARDHPPGGHSGGGSAGGSASSLSSRRTFGQRSDAQVQEFQAQIEQVRSDPANEARRQRVREEQREKERRRAFRLAFNGERWW